MKTVTLTIPDIDTPDPKEAATLFLDALISNDWESLTFDVNGEAVTLTGPEIAKAMQLDPEF